MTDKNYQKVIESLHACMEACNHCYTSSLEEDANHMKACIRLNRECATICSAFEQALSYNTAFIQEYAKLCKTACVACGDECSKHNHDHCKKCAESCYACAKECAQLIA